MIGVGGAQDCLTGADPTASLEAYHAQILRVIIAPGNPDVTAALPCVQTAVSEGYKLNLDIQYLNSWTSDQTAAFFTQVLTTYAPYVWAVSIGNEQELLQGGSIQNGAEYAASWRTVEPIVASLAPDAIRVAGEISPWGESFLKDAVAAGLPGVQAIAAHPYAMANRFDMPSLVAYAHGLGLPLWYTEGLAGPGAWPAALPAVDVPLSGMAGAQVADVWLQL